MTEETNNQTTDQMKRYYKFGGPTGVAFPTLNRSATGTGAQPGTSFVNNGGKVLNQARLQPIFWGVAGPLM